MSIKNYIFLTFLWLLGLLPPSCQPPADESATNMANPDDVNAWMINNQGDTIPTGTPLPIQGKRISPDELRRPEVVPIQSAPIKVPAYSNVHSIREPAAPRLREKSIILKPVKADLPAPTPASYSGEVVPVRQPRPVEAWPLRMKDAATCDIQYLDVDQGMLSSYIRFIYEEEKSGYLWIGTSFGVSRYDGNRFWHYTTEEGLAGNVILSMLEDSKGNLWFGTGKGITRYNGQYFEHFTGETGWRSEECKVILEDEQGYLWFGTSGGAVRYDGQHFTHYTTRHGLVNDHILSMLEDAEGNIWLGTNGGICRFDGAGFSHLTFTEGLADNIVQSMLQDKEGVFWFGTNNGLNRYENGRMVHFTTQHGLPGNEIQAILEDSRGDLWFGTASGSCRFDDERFTQLTTREGLSNNKIRTIIEDSAGNLWFGTGGGGVNRHDPSGFAHFSAESSISDNGFTCVLNDSRGDLWFGVDGGAIRFDGANFFYYTTEQGLVSGEVHAIQEDHHGDLWFGTEAGVSRFDGSSFTNFTTEQGLLHDDIHSIVEDSRDNLWFGSSHGMTRYEPHRSNAGAFTHFTVGEGLLSNRVRTVLAVKNDHLWFGTDRGASLYDGKSITHITMNEGLAGNDVRSILEDSRGNIWFGAGGAGLSLYDGKRFTHYTTTDGLSNNFIWSLVQDREGNIWTSTEKGITLIEISKNSADPKFFTFGKAEGLKRLDFQANTAGLDQENRLWWGTVGLVMLNLDRFQISQAPPKNVRLSHIEINQQFVDYRNLGSGGREKKSLGEEELTQCFDSITAFHNYPDRMTLSHDLNHLTFHFSAIDWEAPRKIQYQYMMEGLDEGWSNPTSEPLADYRNLPHGTYVFQLRATGESQEPSELFSYTFVIKPPIWLTWWAYLLYFLMIAGGVYALYIYLRNRWLLQNELEREQEESKRLKELDSQKSRLYTNLTHEFRTPLTIILGMTEQIRKNPGGNLHKRLSTINRQGRQLLRLVNQLLDLAKLEDQSFQLRLRQNDIVPYLRYVTDSFHTYANGRNLSLRFFTTLEHLVMDYDPAQVKQVLNNLISNAIKFTPSGGSIVVRVKQENEELCIAVSDTGIGISTEELPHIFDRFYQVDSSSTREGEGTGIGLTHTRELLRLMGGAITVQSELNKGTTFTVCLPIQREAIASTSFPEENGLETPIGTLTDRSREKVGLMELHLSTGRPEVLVIEDNPDVVDFLKMCLADKYQIEVAFNGKIGVEKALQHIPDIIISDVMMPELDGFEVCRLLKNDERTSHVPIILLTAKADHESKLTGLKTGADAYLFKPFNEEELLVRLEAMIERQKRLKAYFAQKFQDGYTKKNPSESASEKPASIDEAFMERVRSIVEENYADENFTLTHLCQKLGMSRSQLFRKMKALIDTAPSHFIRTYRLEKAKILLETTDLNISEVAWRTGFKDPAHFSKSFLEEFGHPPSHQKKS